MEKIKILIVDDHDLIRKGIKAMLDEVKDFVIVGEAINGKEAIEQTKKLSPDIIIMDISMPVMTGIESIQIIKNDFPLVKTLILTIHSEDEYMEQIYKSGASGCLYKNAGKNEFELAIRSIKNGERYFCRGLADALLRDYYNKKEESTQNIPSREENPLTKREIEILKLLAEDSSNQKIADKLYISLRTVETHRKNIMQKLHLNSTVALVRYAVRTGIVKV